MTKNYTFNHTTKTIILSKSFDKKAKGKSDRDASACRCGQQVRLVNAQLVKQLHIGRRLLGGRSVAGNVAPQITEPGWSDDSIIGAKIFTGVISLVIAAENAVDG